jgi:hypothetical protein
LKKLARGRAGNIEFKTDENGHFRADGVWAGRASVGFEYNETADIIGWYGVSCTVVPGATTTVTVVDAQEAETNEVAELRCTLKIGDGSENDLLNAFGGRKPEFGSINSDFRMHLDKVDNSEYIDRGALRVVTNSIMSAEVTKLPLGEYNMSVAYDNWHYGRFSTDVGSVNIEAGTNTAEIFLPAACITGSLDLPKKDGYFNVNILCLASNKIVQSFDACCTNSLMIPFLPPDEYTLRMYCGKYGWTKIEPVTVINGIVKLPPVKLQKGGVITGRVFVDWESKEGYHRMRATDDTGFEVSPMDGFNGYNDDIYTFRNLYPGKWAVEYSIGSNVVYSTNVVLHGTETITADIIRHSQKQP